MEPIQLVEEESQPAHRRRIDYAAIAEVYNGALPGQAVKIDRVYNVTLFRAALERWGLTREDANVYQRGSCYIERKSETLMRLA